MKNIFITIITFLSLSSTAVFAEVGAKEKTKSAMDHKNMDHSEHDHAGHDHSEHKAKDTEDSDASEFGMKKIKGKESSKVLVKVHGMVCSFCATGVKKGFLKQSSVEKVNVNLDEMLVGLELKKDKQISVKDIKETVVNSGYEFKGAKYE